jgi:hypothetical protein
MISRPPTGIAYTVQLWSPGFWEKFVTQFWKAYVEFGQPVTITSWWRSPEENRRVGGHESSQHLIGSALDVAPPDGRLAEAFRRAGFTVIEYPTHLHVQTFPAGLARSSGLLDAVGV